MVSSTGTFVSCKDYDDDIDRIDNTLNDLKSKLDALQTKVEGGKYVTNVAKDGEGIIITWNDNSTNKIETIKGDKGDKGDAVEITIDPTTKNWKIDGVDTGICAEGKTVLLPMASTQNLLQLTRLQETGWFMNGMKKSRNM